MFDSFFSLNVIFISLGDEQGLDDVCICRLTTKDSNVIHDFVFSPRDLISPEIFCIDF